MGARTRSSLLPSLSVTMGAIYVAIGGVVAVLLPLRVEEITPDGKVEALAVISSIAFAVTLFAQPLIGAFSDRTRDALGGRVPWVIGSALIGAIAIAAMGSATTVVALCVLWAVGQFALNGADVATSAYVVDSYPRGSRGVPSGAIVASVALGTGVGVVVSGALSSTSQVACIVVAAVAALGGLSFARVQRSRPPLVTPRQPRPKIVWSFARLNPRKYPDFAWAVATRFLFTLGQQGVTVYLLYIVGDIDGVSRDAAPLFVAALTATGLVFLFTSAAIAGVVSDRWGRRRTVLLVSNAVMAFAMLVPLFWPHIAVMFVFAALKGIALGGHLAAAGALISEVLPGGDAAAGRDLGMANVAVNAAQAVAPLLAGAVIVLAGGYAALFVVGIVAALASGVSILQVRSVR